MAGELVAVFCAGRGTPAGDPVLDEAERLGRLLAEAGLDLLNGGYGGSMEALSRGARQAGAARVIGVTLDLFSPPMVPNRWLTEELRVTDFFPRLEALSRADAYVVLRGGIGTLTEATLMWTLLETRQVAPRPFLFVGRSWARLLQAFHDHTLMTEAHFALATLVDTVDQAVEHLKEAFLPSP